MLRRLLIILFACVAVVAAAWLVWPWRYATWGRARSSTCNNNTKQIMAAMTAYALDHDGRWPNALTWPEVLMARQAPGRLPPIALQCTSEKRRVDGQLYVQDRISYAMLQCRSYQSLSADPHPESLIVLYEIGKYGPAYRHNDGMNIGHADGHVKWYYRNRVTPGVILSGSVPPPPAP